MDINQPPTNYTDLIVGLLNSTDLQDPVWEQATDLITRAQQRQSLETIRRVCLGEKELLPGGLSLKWADVHGCLAHYFCESFQDPDTPAFNFPEELPQEVLRLCAAALQVHLEILHVEVHSLDSWIEGEESFDVMTSQYLVSLLQRYKDTREAVQGIYAFLEPLCFPHRADPDRFLLECFGYWQQQGVTADQLYIDHRSDWLLLWSGFETQVGYDLQHLAGLPEACRSLIGRTVRFLLGMDPAFRKRYAPDDDLLGRVDQVLVSLDIWLADAEWTLLMMSDDYLRTMKELRCGERKFSEVPREQWDERLYRTALLSRPETMAEGGPAYLTAELAAYALGEGDPLWLQYVPYDRQNAALVEDAVQRNPAAVAFADPRLISEQLAKEAVMADPQTFCLLPPERQTESLALLAVTQDPELMGEMPERVCTNRVAWAAVYTSLEVVDRIPPALRSADLMYYAISCDPTLARQLPLFLLYDDLFMNRLKAIPNGWSDYLPEED